MALAMHLVLGMPYGNPEAIAPRRGYVVTLGKVQARRCRRYELFPPAVGGTPENWLVAAKRS